MYTRPTLTEEEMERIIKKWATEDLIKHKMKESAIRHIKKL